VIHVHYLSAFRQLRYSFSLDTGLVFHWPMDQMSCTRPWIHLVSQPASPIKSLIYTCEFRVWNAVGTVLVLDIFPFHINIIL
jgi:hypothetical protein